MSQRHNITGQRFGMLVALKPYTQCRWILRCDCGAQTAVRLDNLRAGGARSCGCMQGRAR
jgi:hypothetical protein